MREVVDVKDKILLTVEEASSLSNIGINAIYDMLRTEGCPFLLKVGERKVLIKRQGFEAYLNRVNAI